MTTTSSRASEAELLPCPFCGDKPSTYDAPVDSGDGRWFTHTHVRCPTCETGQTSVEDWNTRAALSAVPPQGQGQEGVYRTLREANVARQAAWCPEQIPDLSFRGVELAGEVGEVCNVIKKLERERLGWRGSRDTVEHLAEELADVVICADLAAMAAGIDLDAAIVAKFNATSEKVGLPQRLSCLTDTPKPGVSADDLAVLADEKRLADMAGDKRVADALQRIHDALSGLSTPPAAAPAGTDAVLGQHQKMHDDWLKDSLQNCADSLAARPAELRGPYTAAASTGEE